MALINCPNCGKQISDKAVICPHCGKKTFTTNSSNGNLATIILAAITGIGGCISIITILLNLFIKMNVPPFRGITYITLAFGFITGLLCLGLAIFGALSKQSQKSYWTVSIIIAILSPLCTYLLVDYNLESYFDMLFEKKHSVKGTYEWTYNGTTASFNVDGPAGITVDGKMAYASSFEYDYEKDCYILSIADKDLNYKNLKISNDMSFIVIDDIEVPLRKVSDSDNSETKEITVSQEDLAKRELEEFKNFRTKDLSAFMLHGKVKSIFESHGGNSGTGYYFSEQGRLISINDDEHYKIKQQDDETLVFTIEDDDEQIQGFFTRTINDDGKLIELSNYAPHIRGTSSYSEFNSNGWPTREKTEIVHPRNVTSIRNIKYPEIDKYGNWTTRLDIDDEGNEEPTYREITYYE